MLVSEFFEIIQDSYKKYFPSSLCSTQLSKTLGRSIWIEPFLAGNRSELSGGYWVNDMMHIRFSIGCGGCHLPSDLELESELPQEIVLDVNDKSYTIIPPNTRMAFGSKSLNFRKVKGSPEKILVTLDKYFSRLKEDLEGSLKDGLIHKNHEELLREKLREVN